LGELSLLALVLLGLLRRFPGGTSSGDFVYGRVGLLGDTLDDSSSSGFAHLLLELLLDESSGVLDGGSSGHLSLVEGVLLLMTSGKGLLGDLVGDLTSDSLELLEGMRFSVLSHFVHSDGGGSSSGTLDMSDDMSGDLLAEFLDEVVLHLSDSLLDGLTGSLACLPLGVLDILGSLFVSRLLDGFLSSLFGDLLHLSDSFSNSLGLSFLGLVSGLADGLSRDNMGDLDVLDSDHLAALSDEDGLLSAEGSAVGTGDLSLDLLEVGSGEFSSRVSQDSSHGFDGGVKGSASLRDLVLEGHSVASSGHLGPHDVLPGLASHSEDGGESVLVVLGLPGLVMSLVSSRVSVSVSTCTSVASMGST